METHFRSIVKALSWRVIATVITIITAWAFTGTVELALKIGFLDTLIKLAAYYFHERAWLKSKIGTKQEPEYQI